MQKHICITKFVAEHNFLLTWWEKVPLKCWIDAWDALCMHPHIHGRFPLPELSARVHGTSWRPENSGAFFWHPSTRAVNSVSTTWVDGPSWQVSKNASEFSGRQLGPWTPAVNSGSGNRPSVSLVWTWRFQSTKFLWCTTTLWVQMPLQIWSS